MSYKPPVKHGSPPKRWSNINIEVSPDEIPIIQEICKLLGWTKVDVVRYGMVHVLPHLLERAKVVHKVLAAPTPEPSDFKLPHHHR